MLQRLEGLINNCNVSRFLSEEESDLRDWYAKFVHEYTINATDVKLTQDKMRDLQEPKNILDILTPSLEAFVVLVMVNNYELWDRNIKLPPGDARRKERGGRWTKVAKKAKTSPSSGEPASPSSEVGCEDDNELRLKFECGWDKAGMDFYKGACKFFKMIRNTESAFEEMKERTQDVYNVLYVIPGNAALRKRMKKRQRLAEKRSRKPLVIEEGEWEMMEGIAAEI